MKKILSAIGKFFFGIGIALWFLCSILVFLVVLICHPSEFASGGAGFSKEDLEDGEEKKDGKL